MDALLTCLDYYLGRQKNEIEIQNSEHNQIINNQVESFLEDIIESYENHLLGLVLEHELVNVLKLQLSLFLSSDSYGKPNNRRRHDGSFYNIEEMNQKARNHEMKNKK